VGEWQSPVYNNMFIVGFEISPTHSDPIGDCGVGFDPFDIRCISISVKMKSSSEHVVWRLVFS